MESRFLIPVKLIKDKGYTQGNVTDDIITTTLRRVQDVNLKPILGTAFFKRLLEGVKAGDLDSDEQALIDDYIAPWLVAKVDHRIIKPLAIQIRSKTVGEASDQYITTANEQRTLGREDELRSDAHSYKNDLIGHLKDNCDLFPTYKDFICNFENIPPEKNQGSDVSISFI